MSEEKNKGGRPPKHSWESLNAKAKAYLYSPSDQYTTILEFAFNMGYTRQHLYDLKKQNAEFSDTLDSIAMRREIMLEKNGLAGDYNSNMAKFALSQCGWSEKQEIKQDVTQMPKVGFDVIPNRKMGDSDESKDN